MTYPVELPGGFSGLSAGQIQGIAKAPFTGHFNNVPMLGDRRPKTLIAATGAWYFDNAPHGDFSGTEQGGTGGPAQMPFSPTGTDGIVTIGRVRTANTTSSFTGEQSITYNHSEYTYKLRVLNTHKAPITASSWDWDASSLTLSDPGAGGDLSGYTYTGWDMVYVTAGTGVQKGWYRIASKTDNNTLVLTADASILSSTDITDTSISIEVYPCNFATYITGMTWNETAKTLTAGSGTPFASYTFGSDDVVLIKGGTGTQADDAGVDSWVKVAGKTSSTVISLVDAAVATNAAADVDIVLFQRPVYEERTIDPALGNGNTITVTSAFTNQPRVGDLYYLYIYTIGGEPYTDITSPTNDPEDAPTESSLTSTYSSWPANTFCSQARMSVQGNQSLCTLPEARINTQMNGAHWGLFTMPKETMIYGDRLQIDFNGGYDYNGTPFIFEIALIPNFDPEADWYKAYDVGSDVRLPAKAIWFQTDPLYHTSTASRDIAFRLECQTGGFSRAAGSSAQYVQNWTMTLDIASGNATDNPYTAPTQQKRYFTRTSAIGDHNYHTKDTRWTVLVKTEHPSMKGKPGYHGYYFAEPFSATTGNGGGVWLHHTGTVSAAASGTTVKIPLAPRSRFTNFNVTYFPNGSY